MFTFFSVDLSVIIAVSKNVTNFHQTRKKCLAVEKPKRNQFARTVTFSQSGPQSHTTNIRQLDGIGAVTSSAADSITDAVNISETLTMPHTELQIEAETVETTDVNGTDQNRGCTRRRSGHKLREAIVFCLRGSTLSALCQQT